jgi:hypothetical protein
VEGFPQNKDVVGWNIATFRWREVDCFLKTAIEESRFELDLVAFQIAVSLWAIAAKSSLKSTSSIREYPLAALQAL